MNLNVSVFNHVILVLVLLVFQIWLNLFGVSAVRADWKAQWERTLEAARREGQVTVYISRNDGVLAGFKKRYPDIKVFAVTGRGLQQRIIAERRARKYIVDVSSGGVQTHFNVLYRARALDPIRSALILPEVVDQANWYKGNQIYADLQEEYIFIYQLNPKGPPLSYNSRLVSPENFKSYWDLVDSRWKGKIVSLDPMAPRHGGLTQLLYFHPELGPKLLRKMFGGMDITFSRNSRQMTDWLAKGRFAICLGCRDILQAKDQGLPVDLFDNSAWKEGGKFSAGPGSLTMLNRAPHPNAAKVFINWLLSREGQIALQKLATPYDSPNSRRIDIPKDDVHAANRIIKGRKYFDVTRPEFGDMTPIFKLLREIRKR